MLVASLAAFVAVPAQKGFATVQVQTLSQNLDDPDIHADAQTVLHGIHIEAS